MAPSGLQRRLDVPQLMGPSSFRLYLPRDSSVRESVIGKAGSAIEILREKFGNCFLREAKVGETFAIRFADKMICAFHHALTFSEPFDFIDELFSSIRVIAKDDHIG
jgi:hypothetical protein